MDASSPIRSREEQGLAPMGRSYVPKEVPLGDKSGYTSASVAQPSPVPRV